MASSRILRTRNVLLLGKSGAGKSTTINMLANLCNFDSFDDAAKKNNEPVVLVPVCFNVTEDGKTIKIQMFGNQRADARNEQTDNPSLSCTQSPRIYSFKKDKNTFNFIDMPGFCDTSGSGQDVIHEQQRIALLKRLPELHAIVVVVSYHTTRINEIEDSLNDVLKLVPRSAAQNLTFLVTHSSPISFGNKRESSVVQETLQTYIDGVNKQYEIHLSVKNNIYYVDYDIFRYLVAYHKSEELRKIYNERGTAKLKGSWIKTREGLFGMISMIMNLPNVPPQSISEISFAQNSLELIIFVLLDVMTQVEATLSPEGYEKLKKSVSANANTLATTLSMTCSRCNANGTPRICHPQCKDVNAPNTCKEVIGHPNLKRCIVLQSGTCKQCQCPWGEHYLAIDLDEMTRRAIDEFRRTMRAEFQKIQDTLVLVASFLKEHSIIPYSTSHINRRKLEENNLKQNGDYDGAEEVEKEIKLYETAAKAIQDLIDKSANTESTKKDYKPELESLLKLKYTGKEIEKAYIERLKKFEIDIADPFVFLASYFPDWKNAK